MNMVYVVILRAMRVREKGNMGSVMQEQGWLHHTYQTLAYCYHYPTLPYPTLPYDDYLLIH